MHDHQCLLWIGTALFLSVLIIACQPKETTKTQRRAVSTNNNRPTIITTTADLDTSDWKPITKTQEEWEAVLTPEEFRILREKGTERAFTGEFWDHNKEGIYTCAACQLPLFSSETKFKSGTGWPSYYQPVKEKNVQEYKDNSHGMIRTEVTCGRCDGHLGHVFNDGPRPTGLRYCINSASLDFVEKK